MNRHMKLKFALALSCFAGLVAFESPAHAITASLPKLANTGSNDLAIGYTLNLITGKNELAKCQNNVWTRLTDANGAPIILGTSGQLLSNLILDISQNGNDAIRRPASNPSWCQGVFNLQAINSNGFLIQAFTRGGNDFIDQFNVGGPMEVIAGSGDDRIIIGPAAGNGNNVWGEDGNDTISTNGSGNDVLSGGNGNDFLAWAGAGSNTCSGGAGTNTCSASTCTTSSACTKVNP